MQALVGTDLTPGVDVMRASDVVDVVVVMVDVNAVNSMVGFFVRVVDVFRGCLTKGVFSTFG